MAATWACALATSLVESESAAARAGDPADAGALESAVTTKLHAGLGKLIGANGFVALLSRAVRLAQRREPALASVTVSAGGFLAGIAGTPVEKEAQVVGILTELFELLARFIGEDLVERVVASTWPDLAVANRKES